MLDCDDHLRGDPRRDLHVVRVEPVGSLLREEEDTADVLAERERHRKTRPVSPLEHHPVARPRRVEIPVSLADHRRLARGDPIGEGEVVERPARRSRGREGLTHPREQPAVTPARLDKRDTHDVEVQDGSHRLAEAIEDVLDLEARAKDLRDR